VTSNLPTSVAEAEVHAIRRAISPSREEVVIGHFGTYGPGIVSLLGQVAPILLKEDGRRSLLLIGRGSERFAAAFRRDHPRQADRILVTGDLSPDGIVSHLAACDCLLQPYPDGVSSRRTSLMAGLALGLPIVTTEGDLTEPIWDLHRAVVMAPASSPAGLAAEVGRLLGDPALRAGLGGRARQLYDDFFSMRHTLERLCGSTADRPPAGPDSPD
jgi:glycosyltransferase involved in cell wall biosynthesis